MRQRYIRLAMSDLTYSVRLLTLGGWGLPEESSGNLQPSTQVTDINLTPAQYLFSSLTYGTAIPMKGKRVKHEFIYILF